jgi:hypothetical protein
MVEDSPSSCSLEVLGVPHGRYSGGHLGIKIQDEVRQWYCWLHMKGDVEWWCHHCDACVIS